MTNMQVAEPDAAPSTLGRDDRPKAVGFVRGDVSGPHAPRHAVTVVQHAHALGYQHVYTVRRR